MLPHLRKTRQAAVAANLLNLGYDAEASSHRTMLWVKGQSDRSGGAIGSSAGFRLASAILPTQRPTGLLLSFHYGLYGAVYPLAAQCNGLNSVAAIIGEQPEEHAESLTRLAREHGFDIEFIKSGPRLIKEARRVISQSGSAVLLIDVPWSKGESSFDVEYEVDGGAFQGRNTLARLIRLIADEPVCVTIEDKNGQIELRRSDIPGVESAYAELGKRLASCPEDYERLDALHGYFRFDRPVASAIAFTVDQSVYVQSGSSRKCYQIKDAALTEALTESRNSAHPKNLTKRIAAAIAEDLSVSLTI